MASKINYGRLMHKALRGLMSEVLADVADNGLPGDHHFFITFDTSHPGVDMPAYLRSRHPDEMTIVLQEWFQDLMVLGDRFAVTLSFDNTPQTLVIPLDSIRTFVDPSVEFGLRFDSVQSDGSDESDTDAGTENEEPRGAGDIVSLDQFRKH